MTKGVNRRIGRWRRRAAIASTGLLLAWPLGSCNPGEFTTTTTITLDGREVVSWLVRAWLLTPIEQAIDRGIDRFFDQFDDQDR